MRRIPLPAAPPGARALPIRVSITTPDFENEVRGDKRAVGEEDGSRSRQAGSRVCCQQEARKPLWSCLSNQGNGFPPSCSTSRCAMCSRLSFQHLPLGLSTALAAADISNSESATNQIPLN